MNHDFAKILHRADLDKSLPAQPPQDIGEQKRPKQSRDHSARHERHGEGEIAQAQALKGGDRVARMNDQCLHPALLPTRALLEPGLQVERRFFIRVGGEEIYPMTQLRQSNAKIYVFGQVPGVPSARLAQRRGAEMRY